MKVLVATNETQGHMADDYSWTVERELVTVGSMECCRPDECGCGRGFAGMASARATTTAMVVEHAHIGEDELRTAVYDWLERGGWFELLDDRSETGDLVDDYVVDIVRTCAAFPAGTVVGRRGSAVFDRQRLAA
jgi:hypothetical protein